VNHWLLKTEPGTYSFQRLLKEKSTHWNGVRNYQARNHLREMKKGDLALIYHSGDDKAVVGVAEVTRGPYPDLEPGEEGDWVQVDLRARRALAAPVPLARIKATRELSQIALVKHTRLSVMPLTAKEFAVIERLGASGAGDEQ
jgi:predicted RNA-binding protein with PUA-like domain